MQRRFFLLFFLTGIFVAEMSSQTFIYKTGKKDMCGDPGDIFSCSVSFTNTSNSPINIHLDRYQKTIPSYWYSCYCYVSCNPPTRDTITIHIPDFATDILFVQFKTDSINPGLSSSDFQIYQLGFQNNADSFKLTANTDCSAEVGLKELNDEKALMLIYPNPTSENLTLTVENEKIKEIRIYNAIGRLQERMKFDSSGHQTVSLNNYEKGVYLIEVLTDEKYYFKRFIKD